MQELLSDCIDSMQNLIHYLIHVLLLCMKSIISCNRKATNDPKILKKKTLFAISLSTRAANRKLYQHKL